MKPNGSKPAIPSWKSYAKKKKHKLHHSTQMFHKEPTNKKDSLEAAKVGYISTWKERTTLMNAPKLRSFLLQMP